MTNEKLPIKRYLLTLLLALGILLVTISPLSFGQVVFKCVDESGTVIFSQSACAIDAERMYVEDSSGGFLSLEQQNQQNRSTQIYESPDRYRNNGSLSNRNVTKGRSLGDPNRTLDGRDKRQVKAQRERDRALDKAIRNVRGTGAEAARIRAELALAKAQGRDLNDKERKRGLDKAIRSVQGTGAEAARIRATLEAAKYGNSLNDNLSSERNASRNPIKTQSPAQAPPGVLIDPFSGTAMPQTGAGYTDPRDGTFYTKVAGGVINSRTGEFIPTNK